MTAIDVGYGAVSGSAIGDGSQTHIDLNNPANDTGIIDTVEMFFSGSVTDVKIGMFQKNSNWNFTMRDYATIGDAPYGNYQVTGLSIDVATNDYIAVYHIGAKKLMSKDIGVAGICWGNLDGFTGSPFDITYAAGYYCSLYGSGETIAPQTGSKNKIIIF